MCVLITACRCGCAPAWCGRVGVCVCVPCMWDMRMFRWAGRWGMGPIVFRVAGIGC